MEALLQFLRGTGLAFVPLFVAIDAIGVLPIMLGLFGEASPRERKRMMNIAVATAAGVGLLFLLLGRALLRLLDIGVAHFAIAGGLILMVLALRDLAGVGAPEMPVKEEMIEVVPIGTPLLAGPATITTLFLLSDVYGIGPVLLAFVLNLLAAWLILRQADSIGGFLGRGGLLAAGKIGDLLLAVIAVRMVVRGIQAIFF